MTEERLKEIKDSIYCLDYEFAVRTIGKTFMSKHLQQERELYNEVVRLREIIDRIKEHINKYKTTITQERADFYNCDKFGNGNLKVGTFMWHVDELEDILRLKQNNLTLEQLTGVENE